WRVEGHRRAARSGVPLQSRALLGRRPETVEGDDSTGAQQSGRRRLDRHLAAALRTARHAGAVEDRPDGIARLRATDQLGRAQAGVARPARHARGVRRMSAAFARSRPPIRHLVAPGLVCFLLVAYFGGSVGPWGARVRGGAVFYSWHRLAPGCTQLISGA